MESLLEFNPQETKVDHKPTVSVIIIFFNTERFIGEAIDSVLAQTYCDWELLLVDDGSSDKSTVIAQQYVEKFPLQVFYFEHQSHQNCGKTASRNLGIRSAQGKYIAFLDADDVWLPKKLEQQIAILDTQPEVGMVYGLSEWWYSWTGKSEDLQRDFMHELGVSPNTCIEPPALIKLFFLDQQAAIPTPSNILVRHEIVKQVNGFDESFHGTNDLYEDQAFYAKIGLQSKVFVTNERWDKYRQHPYSSSSIIEEAGKGYSTRLFFLKWLSSYLSKQELKNDEIIRALKREIWCCRYPGVFNLWRSMQNTSLTFARHVLPLSFRQWLGARWKGMDSIPPVGSIRLRDLRRLTPFSREFGYDRGQPIDRYYIEKFLSIYQATIQGHALEIADNTYTRRFGGDRILLSEILHAVPGNPNATIIGDITDAKHIPSNTFDCIILTQTLQLIYDMRAAIQTIYRILKPGGVVIATLPGISQISRYDMERWGYYWAFTSLSAQRLFGEIFPASNIQLKTYGNVLTATAFLYGMAVEELKQEEMDYSDQDYQLIIGVMAKKPFELR